MDLNGVRSAAGRVTAAIQSAAEATGVDFDYLLRTARRQAEQQQRRLPLKKNLKCCSLNVPEHQAIRTCLAAICSDMSAKVSFPVFRKHLSMMGSAASEELISVGHMTMISSKI